MGSCQTDFTALAGEVIEEIEAEPGFGLWVYCKSGRRFVIDVAPEPEVKWSFEVFELAR